MNTKEAKTAGLVDDMFKAGAHFGYSKTRRHPSVAPLIFTTKNRTDIIDLEKTDTQLAEVLAFVADLAKTGKKILFVGVKPEAKKAIEAGATSLDMPYVIERWIGGTLTNFSEIKKRISKLTDLQAKRANGELGVYTKKEKLMIEREIERLHKLFSGVVNVVKTPEALFVVDAKKEHIAVTEAKKAGVPVIALANSDTNIRDIDYPIVANDAAASSIAFFVEAIVKAYKEATFAAK
ncbi:MAG: 30S ribosomal protein S2 [Candidatus Pacebacteria bacterium]|jgi:small subunit ribosomal protein S2|nr:30S ribosomal protein S2 [Candidatus Paceibacterota bacterium]